MGFEIKPIKSTKSAKKAVDTKKSTAKKVVKPKPAVKPVVVEEAFKSDIKRVPPRIVKKAPVIAKAPPKPVILTDKSKAIEFAMSIAQEMKRSARNEDESRKENEIRLSRRPTTRAHGKNTVKFPADDLKEFKKRLLEARETALKGIDAMKATGFNESGDHEADGGDGTNQTLRLQALGQMGNINRTIQQIEEALHRIDEGTYGVCTVCGQLIRKPRLLNQPFVLTCMECQSEMERQRG